MISTIDIQIGKKIRERRLICGLSQADLAKKAGISPQQVQKYETGVTRIVVDKLYELAETLSVNISYFLTNISENAAELHDKNKTFDYDNSNIDGEEMLKFVKEHRKIKEEMSRNVIHSLIMCILSAEQQKQT
ncbi:helix-turn-helix domain-containing protein [Wolbachia endosymbiont of Folsomia candida]|uniref:helix-turn-helix domain-containing protein n=1 Tax=Wolbachia endosymbiont of Folsomia candida TaxID=169402 RepID=UPI000B0C6D56|nr:helix-turn-helix transcriptional regulator [Wolbachia endosymbiont of Folsomia candida]APR97879.1 XRE family transcriptional regulator [Wolbachia endosymbiont of Folsomia candida]